MGRAVSRGRIEPGAVCIVVGEERGFECNIGAMVTLVALCTRCDGSFQYWTFEKASKPLLVMKNAFTGEPMLMVSSSAELPHEVRGCSCLPGFRAAHLLPIGGIDEEGTEEAPLVVEMASGGALVFDPALD